MSVQGTPGSRGKLQNDDSIHWKLISMVACIEIVRMLIAFSTYKRLTIVYMYIQGAFLNEVLPYSDMIFIMLPILHGELTSTGLIFRLLKYFYGLQRAAKLWNEILARTLLTLGIRRSKVNDCLLIFGNGNRTVYLLVYDDDIVIVGNRDTFDIMKKNLSKPFTTTDIGPCSHFLGIRIERLMWGMFLSQQLFTEKII